MKNLKYLRKSKNISQKNLADAIGVARSTIAMWESEASQPDNDSLHQLADYFDVTVDYLLDRTDDKTPSNKKTSDDEPEIDINSIEYALYGEVRELDEDEKKQLLELVKIMRKKKREFFEDK